MVLGRTIYILGITDLKPGLTNFICVTIRQFATVGGVLTKQVTLKDRRH